MATAFRSFRDAAYEDGQRLPLAEFQKRYRVMNPGVNFRRMIHDNYIKTLKPHGYQAMLDVIDEYLGE